MPDPPPATADLIAELASPDAHRRETAARELFRRGCAAAEPILKNWFADVEFRALIPSGRPLFTVGIAVQSARFDEIRQRFQMPAVTQAPSEPDVQEIELKLRHGVRLDILTTADPSGSGSIARFLARFGEAIQQVECEVLDVDRATQVLRNHFGLQPLFPETQAGTGGTRINFFLVAATEKSKVLIELVEMPRAKSAQ
jgi:hypothetical protein